MLTETKGGEEASSKTERTFIKVFLNRASLGDAEYVFAFLQVDEGPRMPVHVLRADLKTDEQGLNPNGELTGRLAVDIAATYDDCYLVTLQTDRGIRLGIKVNKDANKVILQQETFYRLT